jgi:hypothetical protein
MDEYDIKRGSRETRDGLACLVPSQHPHTLFIALRCSACCCSSCRLTAFRLLVLPETLAVKQRVGEEALRY